MGRRKAKLKIEVQGKAGKIRKIWKIKPAARIQTSRKRDLKAKLKAQETQDWL